MKKRSQLGRDQLVVAFAGLRLLDHLLRQIDANEMPAERTDERSAQSGPAASVEHRREFSVRAHRERLRDGLRRAIVELLEVGLECLGGVVEELPDVVIRSPMWRVLPGHR